MRNWLYFVLGSSENSVGSFQALTPQKVASLDGFFEPLSRARNRVRLRDRIEWRIGRGSIHQGPSLPWFCGAIVEDGCAPRPASIRAWPREALPLGMIFCPKERWGEDGVMWSKRRKMPEPKRLKKPLELQRRAKADDPCVSPEAAIGIEDTPAK
jgi:hypothetical protein